MLERTLGYRQWAAKQRKYLYDDKAVEDFQPYGLRRRSLPSGDNLFSTPLQARELVECTVLNPANRAPIEYAGAMYLLNKDLDAFEKLIGNYYGSPALHSLPTSFQEAAIILNEAATPEEFAKRGVTREVIARFARFKQLYLQNRKSPNLSSLMKREFGKTYWYYFTFVITD